MKIKQKIKDIKARIATPKRINKLETAKASLTHADLLQQVALLKSIGDHISVMDKELNIIWANDTAKKIFGNDIIGKKCYEVYHKRKDPCEPYPCLTLKAFEDGDIQEHYTQVIDKDGKAIYFHCTATVALKDKEGNPRAVVEISRDITEKRKAEEELMKYQSHLEELVKERTRELTTANKELQQEIVKRRQAEEKLKNERQRLFFLLDELPALVYLQAPDYSIRYANKYFREHFGDPTGKYCHEVLMKCKQPCHDCPTFRVFATQKPQHWEINTPEGKSYDVYDYPFTDIDGTILVLDLSIDVTERKKMEQELRKRMEQIQYRLEIEEALAKASKLLISSEKIDLHQVLKIVGEAIEVNRAYIFQLRDNGLKADMTYEWCSPMT